MEQLIKTHSKKSENVISERAPFWFVWDKELKVITELWASENPTIFYLIEFETFAYSGLVNSWAPYAGASNRVLTKRKFWLCGTCQNDVDKMLNYVEKGYSPLGKITCEQFLDRNQQVVHIEVVQ